MLTESKKTAITVSRWAINKALSDLDIFLNTLTLQLKHKETKLWSLKGWICISVLKFFKFRNLLFVMHIKITFISAWKIGEIMVYSFKSMQVFKD